MNMNVVRALVASFCAIVMAGCGMDSAELGEYVRKEMQDELVKTDGLRSLKMKNVRLIRGEGIKYEGVGKGEIDGQVIRFDVTCKYDGKTVLWDASLRDDELLSLAAVEKSKAIANKIRAAWPEVKRSLVEKYGAMAKKASERIGEASKKAAESLEAATEKLKEESQNNMNNNKETSK